MLTTLLLLRSGYEYVPFSSREGVIENSKESYHASLRRTQSTLGTQAVDWQPWLEYFLTALVTQKSNLAKKLHRAQVVLANLPELSARILELGRERGRVTVRDFAQETGISRNTIKDHLSSLTARGYLIRHGAGRGTWYSLS